MLTLFSVIFWLAVALGALALWGYLTGRIYRLETEPDSIHFVTTEDGWRVSLTRYCPADPLAGAPPVILCPGAGMRGVIFDASQETSLARYLAKHGHDVWLLDLRGREHRPLGRRPRNWAFDDYVEFDVPAALRTVCAKTGAKQVQWVGFGLGALVMWGVLASVEARRVCSLVALAAPVFFRRQQATFRPRLLRWMRLVRPDYVVRLFAPLLGRLHLHPLKALQNRDNVDGPVYRRALVHGLCGLSRTELLQYAEWLEHDTFTAIVQRRDYRSAMGAIATPTLLIAGPRDEMAPVDMVEATQNLLEDNEQRALVVASRMHGMSTNYGHLDLLLGRGVARDIFPHVLKWLDLHAGVEIPADRPEPPEPREGWEEDPYLSPSTERARAATGPAVAPQREEVPAAAPVPEATPAPDFAAELEEPDEPEDEDEDEQDLVQGDVPRLPPEATRT
jgi:polyhydroxyalkanoate synthase